MGANDRQYIAHVVPEYLGHTMNWIYNQIKYQRAFSAYVLTQKCINLDSYPIDMVFTSRDDAYSLKKTNIIERIQRRIGRLPFEERRVFSDALRKFPPIAIQAHFGWDSYFSIYLKNKFRVPLISRFYGYDIGILPRIPLWRRRYTELFSHGDLFLVEGNYMKRSLALLGCPLERIVVHRLGIDIDAIPFSNNRFIGDDVRILMAASFKQKKGFEFGLEAISLARKMLPSKNISVTIIGDGELRDKLKMIAHKRGIQDIIKWEGYKSHDYFLNYLTNADIYLSPSITSDDGDTEGGAPVAVIEAGASGIPVVSSFHADIPEVVIDGVTGLLAKEKDVVGLADAICNLVSNKDMALTLGSSARQHVEKNYSAVTQGKELEGIYSRYI